MKNKRLIILAISAVIFISATAFMLVDSRTEKAPKLVETTTGNSQMTLDSNMQNTGILESTDAIAVTTETVIETTISETESKVTVTEIPNNSSNIVQDNEDDEPMTYVGVGGNGNDDDIYGTADIDTGISWDGSPILYYYKDGTTGYEPKTGAEYELKPGIWAEVGNLNPPKDDGLCTNGCGRKRADCDSRLCDWHCDVCNVDVKEFECHPRH